MASSSNPNPLTEVRVLLAVASPSFLSAPVTISLKINKRLAGAPPRYATSTPPFSSTTLVDPAFTRSPPEKAVKGHIGVWHRNVLSERGVAGITD